MANIVITNMIIFILAAGITIVTAIPINVIVIDITIAVAVTIAVAIAVAAFAVAITVAVTLAIINIGCKVTDILGRLLVWCKEPVVLCDEVNNISSFSVLHCR
jgi:hypothetical protein